MHDFTQFGFSEEANAAANEILEFRACMRDDGSVYGTAGQCRIGTETQKKPNLALKAYIRLMKKAREQQEERRKDPDRSKYHEHHAFPKAIFKNKETANNKKRLLLLTHGEHFQAHYLIYNALLSRYGAKDKRTIDMGHAIGRMAGGEDNTKLTKKQYEAAMKVRAEVMKQNKNTKGNVWVNDGTNNKQIHPNDPIPEGWSKGRINVETGKWFNNGVNNLKVKKGENVPAGYQPGRANLNLGKFYNDGKSQIRVKDGQVVPEGFKPGKLTGVGKDVWGKGKWYNDGVSNKRIEEGSPVPEGFSPGRLGVKAGDYYNNGSKNIRVNKGDPVPEGFERGRLSPKKGKS